MLKLRSNLSYSTQGMFLIPLVLQNSGNSEKTEENISNATSTKYSPFFPPVSVENNNRDPTKTNFHESHPSWLFLPWYSPPKIVKKIVRHWFVHKRRAESIQPKFPGWGSKISWGQMDRDRSERSRSIPLPKRVSRSFKMKDVGSLLLVLKLDDDFDRDINDIMWASSFLVI